MLLSPALTSPSILDARARAYELQRLACVQMRLDSNKDEAEQRAGRSTGCAHKCLGTLALLCIRGAGQAAQHCGAVVSVPYGGVEHV